MTIPADSPPKQSRNASAQERSQKLRQRIDDSLNTLVKDVDEVRASQVFKQHLDVQARFHRYSWHNSMLIA